MNSFEVKNKDRSPNETIQILKKFFLDRGYDLFSGRTYQNDIGTWCSNYTLYFQDTYVLSSNGKGISEEYAIASGLSELYERFCNKMPLNLNPFVLKRYLLNQKENKNFYWDKNETEITYEEQSKRDYFQPLKFLFNEPELEQYIKLYNPCGIFEVPFKSINGFNDMSINISIINKLYTSTGMAAGNSLEEALNQGISEIFERYVSEKFYKEIQNKYYCINYNKLENQKLKQLCKNLEKDFNIFIFDLSYNFNVPVVMLVGMSKRNYRTLVSFGSFPIFDIALERTITELYQGIYSHRLDNTLLQTPYNDSLWYEPQVKHAGSYIGCPIFPEVVFNNIDYVDNISNIYLKNGNNNEVLNYYKTLSQKLNIDFYYYDNSLINEMTSVLIYSKGIAPLTGKIDYLKNEVTDEQRKKYFIYYKTLYLFVESIYNNSFDYDYYFSIFPTVSQAEFEETFHNFANIMFQADYLSLYPSECKQDKNISLIWKIYRLEEPQSILNYAEMTLFFKNIKKYFTLLKYTNNKTYSNQSIKDLFKLFNTVITDEDINNSYDPRFLIKKIFIEPLREEYYSDKFNHIINTLI